MNIFYAILPDILNFIQLLIFLYISTTILKRAETIEQKLDYLINTIEKDKIDKIMTDLQQDLAAIRDEVLNDE